MPSEAERHRTVQLAIRAAALRRMQALWRGFDPTRVDETYPVWERAAVALIRAQRGLSAAAARAYVRRLRDQAGVPGEAPVIAPVFDEAKVAASLRVTSAVSVKKAAARGVPPEQAAAKAFVATAGAVSRHVLDAGRDVVLQSVAEDEYAVGWQRITSGRSCGFCQMLAGRGAVYTEGTADFGSHDHCGCSAEPVYDPSRRRAVQVFVPSERSLAPGTRAVNAERARQWMRDNGLI